jgi:hypothetical protein
LAANGFVRYSDSAYRRQKRDTESGGQLESTKGIRDLGWASLLFALLQSLCTAVLTISGIRVAIGLGALAASGVYPSLLAFHRDAFRIPMLALATVGAIINLAVLAWIWRLRAQPSAAWRKRELSSKEKRSERLQVVLAVVTLLLVGLESWSHVIVHRPPQATGTVRISTQ